MLSALGTNLSFLFKHRGAVAAPDVDARHPVRSAVDLFHSRWWTIGWSIAVVAFFAHVAALSLLPLSLAQAVLSGRVRSARRARRAILGFSLGRRQWLGVSMVTAALILLGVTGQSHRGSSSNYSVAAMLLFEGAAVGLGLALIFSDRLDRMQAQPGVLLGASAGLGFGVSDVAIKAVSGDVLGGLPWIALALCTAVSPSSPRLAASSLARGSP